MLARTLLSTLLIATTGVAQNLAVGFSGQPLGHSRGPAAVAHVGSVELTPNDALRSARAVVASEHRELLGDVGGAFVARNAPIWLPSYCRDRALAGWLRRMEVKHPSKLLDRDDLVRDHGFGLSYQTRLVVDHAIPTASDLVGLGGALGGIGERFLVACGGTILLWAVLALAFWWVDRLTRGYMTGRLATLSALFGTAVPAVGFLAL